MILFQLPDSLFSRIITKSFNCLYRRTIIGIVLFILFLLNNYYIVYFKLSNEEFCKLFCVKFNKIRKLNCPESFAWISSEAVNDLIQSDYDGIIIDLIELLEAVKELF